MFRLLGRSSKVGAVWDDDDEEDDGEEIEEETKSTLPMYVVQLHTLIKRYGGQRYPKVDSYEAFSKRGELIIWKYIPAGSTVIFISHEWTSTNDPDPDGNQMFHLLTLFERLRQGMIHRTDMNALHSLIYKHNHTTTAEEWKHMLSSNKTFVWYDGFCIPKSRREDRIQSIPIFMRRCNFTIILSPGCSHSNRIDPRTQRKINLCYRTYRLRARCVFEMFCAFLITKGGENAKPILLVRSGTGFPNWISPLECQKLAVGMSSFECCDSNHEFIRDCRRPIYHTILVRMINSRVRSIFLLSGNFAVARISISLTNYWCRGLLTDQTLRRSWNSLLHYRKDLRWKEPIDQKRVCRDGFPLLFYAALTDCINLVRDVLEDVNIDIDAQVPRAGRFSLSPFKHTHTHTHTFTHLLSSHPITTTMQG